MGSLECVDILLQSPLHTPELTLQPEKHGWTPFLYAIYREQVPCAMRLLQRSKVDIHSSSCSSSSKMTVMSGKKSDTSTGQSLFDIYDYENALLQLRLLGSIVQLCSRGDERVRAAMETLSTVPEFRQVVNTILRSHMDKVDEELGFLLLCPSLLDIESKLLVLKKACLHLHDIIVSNSLEYEKQWRPQPIVTNKDELEVGALFPILVRRSSRNHTPKIDVKLPRQNPWRGLVDIFRRRAASKSKL